MDKQWSSNPPTTHKHTESDTSHVDRYHTTTSIIYKRSSRKGAAEKGIMARDRRINGLET
jgi:hypothetical protein